MNDFDFVKYQTGQSVYEIVADRSDNYCSQCKQKAGRGLLVWRVNAKPFIIRSIHAHVRLDKQSGNHKLVTYKTDRDEERGQPKQDNLFLTIAEAEAECERRNQK